MKKTSSKSEVRHVAAREAGVLNAAQQQAVQHGRPPLLIIAGAGTWGRGGPSWRVRGT